MNNDLDRHAQLNVEITNLYAEESELEMVKQFIEAELKDCASPAIINFDGDTRKGARYEINFQVFDSKRFNLRRFWDGLLDVGVVGFNIDQTYCASARVGKGLSSP